MMIRRAALCLGAAMLFNTGCGGCGGGGVDSLQAFVNVDACADRGTTTCALDFGGVSQGGSQTAVFSIRNERVEESGQRTPGEKDLVISSIRFADNSDPAFSIVGELPTKVV